MPGRFGLEARAEQHARGQTRRPEELVQPQPEVHIETGGAEALPNRIEAPRHQRQRGNRSRGAHLHFLEREKPAGSHLLRQMAQDRDRIRLIDQHQPAHDGIERFARPDLGQIRHLEAHVGKPGGRGASGRKLDGLRRSIDAQHAAGWADEPRSEKRYIPGATTDVEHAHAGAQAGVVEHLFGQVTKQARLIDQPAQLGIGVAQKVRLHDREV